jgi:hypothetical protein
LQNVEGALAPIGKTHDTARAVRPDVPLVAPRQPHPRAGPAHLEKLAGQSREYGGQSSGLLRFSLRVLFSVGSIDAPLID